MREALREIGALVKADPENVEAGLLFDGAIPRAVRLVPADSVIAEERAARAEFLAAEAAARP